MNKLKQHIVPLLLLGCIFLVYHTWIFSRGILTHGDWTFFYPETQAYFYAHSFSLWNSINSFGRVALEIGQAPTFYFYGLLQHVFGTDFAMNERIIYYWPVAFLTPFSSYILLNKLFRSKVAVFVGAIYYSFNTYFLVIQTGHLTLMTTYAIAPLLIACYMYTLETRKVIWAILTGVLFYVSTIYEPRGSYIVFGVLFLYSIYTYLFLPKKQLITDSLRFIFTAALPFLITLSIILYWIVALANVGVLASNELFQRTLYGNEFYSIVNAIALFHPFWTGGALAVGQSEAIMPYFFLFPILAVAGLYVHRLNKIVTFFGIIAFLGIFLTKQSDIPFSSMYQWLYGHFPGFNAFRESSKFYFLTALGYSVLIASFFAWLYTPQTRITIPVRVKNALTILVIGCILVTTKPLITGELGTLFITRTPRSEFLQVRDFVMKQDTYFRTLWVPVTSRWSSYNDLHPAMNLGLLADGEWNSYIRDEKLHKTRLNNILVMPQTKVFPQLLNLSSIKYIIVTSRLKNSEEDWVGMRDNREEYLNALDQVKGLKKVPLGITAITVYENPTFRPHFYITKQKESLTESIPFQEVQVKHAEPTKYHLRIVNIREPFYLEFTETYHPDWQLHDGSFTWWDIVTKKGFTVDEGSHTKNVAGFNEYYLDPKALCQKMSCIENRDGSYTVDVVLAFKPQVYVVYGMQLSGILVTVLVSYLVYYGIKKTHIKR